MSLSFFYTMQDSLGKMSKQFVLPLRQKGAEISHVAAHAAGDIFAKLREDAMRDELGNPNDSPENRYLAWENELPNKLKHAADSSKFLATVMLTKLREDIAAAGFDLPASQAFESLKYNKEDEKVKMVMSDIESFCKNNNISPPLPK